MLELFRKRRIYRCCLGLNASSAVPKKSDLTYQNIDYKIDLKSVIYLFPESFYRNIFYTAAIFLLKQDSGLLIDGARFRLINRDKELVFKLSSLVAPKIQPFHFSLALLELENCIGLISEHIAKVYFTNDHVQLTEQNNNLISENNILLTKELSQLDCKTATVLVNTAAEIFLSETCNILNNIQT